MTERREIKRLAQEIRRKTGVPLGPANVIARHLHNYDKWELNGNPATNKWCATSYRSFGCDCCGGETVVTVTGPKGTYTQ